MTGTGATPGAQTGLTVAALPSLPTGREYEELIGAAFHAAGHYVERDITERDGIEILQLDGISTDYSSRPPFLHLIEAKAGNDWGFKDIFKILGWKTYLKLNGAALVTSRQKERFADYQRLAERVGVKLIFVPDPKNLGPLTTLIGEVTLDERDVRAWRFACWVERALMMRVRTLGNGQPEAKRFKAIQDHAFQINSDIFFQSTVAGRVEALYETYRENRNLTGKCGIEIDGGTFDTEDARIPSSVFAEAFYNNGLDEIQAACWSEHRARLSLLKAAVDYICYKADGLESKAESTITWKIGEKTLDMPTATMPGAFERALEEISKEPHFRRYPVFWQWFLGVFGGFILKDYKDQEYELLSMKTGIPVDHVDNAFAAFDKLFQNDAGGGWFRETEYSNVQALMLYPSALKGVGANYRREMYVADKKFASLTLTKAYTGRDLVRWNNAVVRLLTR